MVVNKLNDSLAALSDDTRRAILARLMRGPASVNELAEPFRMSQQAVSKHLAILERADLIQKHRAGRRQICRLNAAPLREVADWVGQYRKFWEGAFDRLDDLLGELNSSKQRNREP